MTQELELELPAGEWVDLGPGNYFAFLDGSDTISIEYWHDSGRLDDSVDKARPGYWAEPPKEGSNRLGTEVAFTNVRVKSAVKQSATIVVLWGRGGERRLTGIVETVDGGRERSASGLAFTGSTRQLGVASEFSAVQILNPAGSGKTIVLSRLLGSVDAGASISATVYSTALGTLEGNWLNKLSTGSVGTAEIRYETNASKLISGVRSVWMFPGGAGWFSIKLEEPILLEPGDGFMMEAGTADVGLYAMFEGYEE